MPSSNFKLGGAEKLFFDDPCLLPVAGAPEKLA